MTEIPEFTAEDVDAVDRARSVVEELHDYAEENERETTLETYPLALTAATLNAVHQTTAALVATSEDDGDV